MAKLMDALGCQADSALADGFAGLAEKLVVGRPVDRSALECLPETV